MRCTGCNNNIPDGAKFCPVCGAMQQNAGVPFQNGQGYVPPQQYPPPAANVQQKKKLTSPCYVGFLDAIKLYFKNYINFKGRSTRSEYWYACLFTHLVMILCYLLNFILPGVSYLEFVAFFVPNLAISYRRFHDVGWSGIYPLIKAIVCGVWSTLSVAVVILFFGTMFGLIDDDIISVGSALNILMVTSWLMIIPIGMSILEIVICCMAGVPTENKYGKPAE